jgi:hypothetical protein
MKEDLSPCPREQFVKVKHILIETFIILSDY